MCLVMFKFQLSKRFLFIISKPVNTCIPVQVISGFQLPYKSEKLLKTDRALSVQVRLTGVDDDVQCDRTKTVKNNGPSRFE